MNYPTFDTHTMIGFDIEGYDPKLKEKGPGVYRRDGYILGVAISDGHFSEYYNFDKSRPTDQNIEKNVNYISDVLGKNNPKLGTNIMYDIDWLQNGYGIQVNGELNDIQIAEPLLDSYRYSYSLDALGKDYLGIGKDKNEIDTYCGERGWKGDSRQYLYKVPYELVRKYAKMDALLPLQIFEKQKEELEKQGLLDLYRLEMDLTPLLLQMRKVGVRLDVPKIQPKIDWLKKKINSDQYYLDAKYGKVNVRSGKQMKELFDRLGLQYFRKAPTEKMILKGVTEGNPVFDKDFLEGVNHEFCQRTLDIRAYSTILSTFFQGSYVDKRVGERLHGLFHQLKTDDNGTLTGRLSGTKPNLQNQPSKGQMGTFCREIFLPELGCDWGKIDFSQIEYRFLAHFATGKGAKEIREKYNNNPNTDYHQFIMDITGLERKPAKTINFGVMYFMGIAKLSKKLGCTYEEAKSFMDIYHDNVPFLRQTRTNVLKVAKTRGYVKTVLNRRDRVSQKMIEDKSEFSIFAHLISGSAADYMKKSMVDSYQAGLFNVLHPHITVHDELDFSIPRTKEGREATKELKYIMENCLKLNVPVIAELEVGPNWGHTTEEAGLKLLQEAC
jgi:DNA polymerase-1